MICPVCKLELGVERRAGELVLTYGLQKWSADCCCRERGDPVQCCRVLPAVMKLMANGKAPSVETGKPAKPRAS